MIILLLKDRNFCSKLYKKERENYYNSLDIKNITDINNFGKQFNPFCLKKSKQHQK